MLKKLGLFIGLSCFVLGANSQLKFGVNGGMNYIFSNHIHKTQVDVEYMAPFYKVSTKSEVSKSSGISPVFGIFLDPKIAGGIWFQTEMNLSFRYYNNILEDVFQDSLIKVTRQDYGYHKLMFLEIPLLLKYNHKINTGRYGRDNYIGFFIGPVLGLKLSDNYIGERTVTYEGYEQTSINTSKDELSSGIESKFLDLGAAAGIQYDKEKGFRIGIKYIRSLIATNKNEYPKVNHNIIQLTLGWNFIEQ